MENKNDSRALVISIWKTFYSDTQKDIKNINMISCSYSDKKELHQLKGEDFTLKCTSEDDALTHFLSGSRKTKNF